MSSKRKSDAPKKPAKRGKKKQEEDYDSEFSDGNDDLDGPSGQPDEVLIPGHGEDFEPPSKLPEDLLHTYDKEPGYLLLAGMITWEMVARRDTGKPKLSKVRPNLTSFHRFTDEKYRLVTSSCSSAHTLLVNMDRKAMSFGRNQHGQLGHPELVVYEKPTVISSLEHVNVIQTACGRNHSLFLTGKSRSTVFRLIFSTNFNLF